MHTIHNANNQRIPQSAYTNEPSSIALNVFDTCVYTILNALRTLYSRFFTILSFPQLRVTCFGNFTLHIRYSISRKNKISIYTVTVLGFRGNGGQRFAIITHRIGFPGAMRELFIGVCETLRTRNKQNDP